MLYSLIENTIKYKSGENINITLSKNGIEISNDTKEYINNEQVEMLADIFYQGDGSRYSTGYVLGPALVSNIVDISRYTLNIFAKDRTFTLKKLF